MILVFLLIFVGFVLGVATIVAAEALGVLLIIKRLNQKAKLDESKIASKNELGVRDLDPQQSLDFAFNKQGIIWVLGSDKIPKTWVDKAPKEQKKTKDFVEVSPVRKYAKIKDQSLMLTEPDGSSLTHIQLKGCIVEAVSATSLSSRKWAKRFPIKLESKSSVIYNGSKTFYIYVETSWEKESWCKALRLASCEGKEKLHWFSRIRKEFHSYLVSLNSGHPSLMKPSVGFCAESIDRESKPDVSSSKVRHLWKKLAKKTSRVGVDNKSTWVSSSGHEERKMADRLRPCQDAVLATGLMKTASTAKGPKSIKEESVSPPLLSSVSLSGSQSHISVSTDVESDEKFGIDEGTLCWNLLISRLFFDVKGSTQLKRSIQARIQRALSNMRIPSYIGEVICTDIDIGNLPPYISGMRVLPVEMNEVWALEVEVEYSGGMLLDIETRLEVRELNLDKRMVDSNPEFSTVADVSSDLLEGFKYFGNQLNLPEGTINVQGLKEEGDPNTVAIPYRLQLFTMRRKSDIFIISVGLDYSPDLARMNQKVLRTLIASSTSGSRWKSILNSIAKQMSQVSLSLEIRIASLRGTLRLHIKPPPSDQLWYGFTSMPDIDFNLDSSVGDHKVTNGHIALFLVNRLKAAIRETLVLPNCESISIPWMSAENGDWVPRNVAPFIWVNQETGNDSSTSCDALSLQTGEAKTRSEASTQTSSDGLEPKQQNQKPAEFSQEPARKSSDSLGLSSSSTNAFVRSISCMEELQTPQLQNDEPHKTCEQDKMDISGYRSLSGSSTMLEKQNRGPDEDDGRPKRIGRKERMLDLRKKMGEKFEEKKRHIEEKSRHIVEKMRGP
ncbi:testis-expressed sequence 2 protein-like [Quillaja saponaria]|uniref:Testis-expressed sequence 2 protein-like n=1 Tax=Quillaja saponaria TaxID=32244 RepID=A0AAD7Q5Y2_QUISA|nr:testis-expressed sequence 2 protein-like [Quillaja saponaria]